MKLGVRTIDACGLAGVVAAGAATYFGAIVPTIERTRTTESLRGELSEWESDLSDARSDARALSSALEDARLRFAEGLASLRPVSKTNVMHGELASLAADHGLVIDEVRPGDPRPVGRLLELPLTVSARGGYVELVRFLGEAHAELGQMEVRGFSVQGDPAQPGLPLAFTLDLAWLADRAGEVGVGER